MKTKAFTLIELLVVVAIIGILAAVGVTTFGGFQDKAKVSAAKANHKSIEKYIAAEIIKCDLGDTNIMKGFVNCPITNSSQVIFKIDKAITSFKNPFNSSESAVNLSWSNYNDNNNIGRTLYGQNSWNNILFATCFKLPCANANNKIITYVYTNY